MMVRIPAHGAPVAQKETLMSALVRNWAAALICTAFALSVQAGEQIVVRAGDNPSQVGSSKFFDGQVRQDVIAPADEFSHNGITYVTFEPGARTFWHSHPGGQRLLVTAGKGLVGTKDGEVTVVRPGDFIWCPPDVLHWHGASPTTAMTHIAFTNAVPGKTTHWDKPLSAQEYADLARKAMEADAAAR